MWGGKPRVKPGVWRPEIWAQMNIGYGISLPVEGWGEGIAKIYFLK
jgi:hypothetical protein